MTARTRTRHYRALRVGALAVGAAAMTVLATLTAPAGSAGASSFVPITGDGSSWSAGAIGQWIVDEHAKGIQVNYTPDGSTTGRNSFISGQVDFAASDIPFQTSPGDGTAPEHPQQGSYAYMPITAGGTVFMYNLSINGQRVTNLRLSPANVTKIFTGAVTNWDDPALASDNPGLKLPNQSIVPVVRSDGSGTSFELTQWMISQNPGLWNSYCTKAGRAPACGATSFYPTVTGMIAQNADLGVSSYVSQAFAAGSVGYVNYYYAIKTGFPVVNLLNAAGYYTEPTPQNVAVSLLQDQVDTTDTTNPALYLTQKLQGVYTDPDPRTYPLSSYGYMILPTTVGGSFNTNKGATLAQFSYDDVCQGQSDVIQLGYSPMPINLVQAAFAQIAKIPGANVQNINVQNCRNPTFTTSGVNLLAQTAPNPPACDHQGPTQCTTGTAGAAAVSTPVSGNATAASAAAAAAASAGAPKAGATAASSDATTSAAATGASPQTCDPTTGACTAAAGTSTLSDPSLLPTAQTATLAGASGWSTTQTLLLLIGLALLALMLIPGLLSRRLEQKQSP